MNHLYELILVLIFTLFVFRLNKKFVFVQRLGLQYYFLTLPPLFIAII